MRTSKLRRLIELHPNWPWTDKAIEQALEMSIEEAIKKGFVEKRIK